ncbi:hypothetical protein [Streptomyces shenzhenensis]|uniref:C2H2-type domain-containing protein n=1 Tax=Streptomyces shenzhenensis TaxID=943815 RepID=A0A3M0I5S6_9ACTN|nr:hypothetical protein [Streptomyces shenzhenensis]RMB83668.1 hypothetical protein CTZ28_23410 [Streptomyces shenzhenensis]
MIRDHWFRADHTGAPCLYSGCGRPQAEHVESVGEWMAPRHWFRPVLRRPSRCAQCGRPFGHSTHHGSRKNRRLWHTR